MSSYGKNEKRVNILRRTAKETIRYRMTMKILGTALALMLIMTAVLYASAALYKNSGSFTISVNKLEMQKYGLTLSETPDMRYQSSTLNAQIAENITNIAEEQLPANIDMQNGAHNGDNYIAYTFYLQNAGEIAIAYQYDIKISNITNNLDEAIRIKLYRDGVPTTFAKTASDGSGAELGTTEFYSTDTVVQDRVDDFNPGDITKFTVVVWIEGNDPDCVDWLIGGELKLDMTMSVVH